MFIELVDALRCTVPHEDSWLVLAADRIVARHVIEGVLGCPVCRAQYTIHQGVVDFAGAARYPIATSIPSSREQATRLAAFLGLDDAISFATLMGAWGAHAVELRGMIDCPLVLVDPPGDVEAAPGLSILRTSGLVPIAAGTTRGLAIDVTDLHGSHEPRVDSAVRATRSGGRIVAPSTLPLPAGVHELARDGEVWVAQRDAIASPLVTLHVRRGV